MAELRPEEREALLRTMAEFNTILNEEPAILTDEVDLCSHLAAFVRAALVAVPSLAREAGEREDWRDGEAIDSPSVAIARLCALQREIAEKVTGYGSPNDCFCLDPSRGGLDPRHWPHWRHSGETIRFIEAAVREKIAKLAPTPPSGGPATAKGEGE